MKTKDKIIQTTQRLFARRGYDGVSMRLLAERMHISPSVIYHYFDDKDVLLQTMYEQTNKDLGQSRALLQIGTSFEDNITQLVQFQFDHMQEIVAVLKYYLHFRTFFLRSEESKMLPQKAILHVQEVVEAAVAQGYLQHVDIPTMSKHVTHVINGYVLEIFPVQLSDAEKKELVSQLSQFIVHSFDRFRK